MNQLYTRHNIIISLTISLVVVSFFVCYTFRNMKKARYESQIVHTRLQSLTAMEGKGTVVVVTAPMKDQQ
jgi:uncharacterized membrane protein SirB2